MKSKFIPGAISILIDSNNSVYMYTISSGSQILNKTSSGKIRSSQVLIYHQT